MSMQHHARLVASPAVASASATASAAVVVSEAARRQGHCLHFCTLYLSRSPTLPTATLVPCLSANRLVAETIFNPYHARLQLEAHNIAAWLDAGSRHGGGVGQLAGTQHQVHGI